ncbi:ABC transporter substrate-binding protein [Pseudonocardia sp. NPDC049635]|uniref:ABC transporter substrate-binding protein n=1 Tax=Pseudonocardia sp. NPDC049635 TaxID=3155506 RepID=UPI0033E5B01F
MIRPAGRTGAVLAALLAVLVLAGCARDARPAGADVGATRVVEHVMGSTEVPAEPQRVVLAFPAFLDTALEVGVVPVAAPRSRSGFPAYLGSETAQIADLGAYDEGDIDPERIGQQNPDLILFNQSPDQELDIARYEQLNAIAPAVPIETGQQNFRHVAEQVAEALGRTDQLREAAARYEDRVERVREALAAVPEADLPVSLVRLRADHVRVMTANNDAGQVIASVGLNHAPPIPGAELTGGAAGTKHLFYETSLELLPEALGDYVFAYSSEDDVLESATRLPVWQTIPAVQQGTMFEVDFEVWMRGQGYRATHAMLDDLTSAYGVQVD